MIRLAFVILVLATPAAMAKGVSLPLGFDGRYAPEGMPCETPRRITVRDGTMTGDDFVMTVTDLIEFPGEANKVDASLEVTFGGRKSTEASVITLKSDGEGPVLVFDFPDGTRNIWKRCD